MSLADLAEIGSFISALAVLGSLVYLSRQLSQADRNQQATIRAARIDRIISILMTTADATLVDASTKGPHGAGDLTDQQVRQFITYAQARLYNAEDSFYQHKEGLLNDVSFAHVEGGLRISLSQPGFRAVYKRQRPGYGADFVAFADRLLAETQIAPPVDIAAQWRADVAAEQEAAKRQLDVANTG
jgi:hypothetical protein